jgi:dipeptidase|eukprot:CAMPEP_0174287656 /NCGR_PEP_ID=MMETSP0809-20121228/16818_1 /TAXON_ID=73025 ORGANISM="Eutreptiella gymnastica-like, Strain CCMP1594" /NCGR_SAMPLE_ID=MMETSP0809 /ASSEMBLY_ACC=CAM_ASM_000658 /LENGTH=638 /DNA_ID=CAMNT_0015384321 /DNA_START=60 /DNA_END=1976 /DNA_ORIENTATION=+
MAFIRLGLFLLAMVPLGDACTLIAAGKDATKDGSVMVSHTDDAGEGTSDLRLINVPAQDHGKDSLRPVYSFKNAYPRVVAEDRSPLYGPKDGEAASEPLGHIPQVEHTYAYFDQDYAIMNEVGLIMGESTCAAKTVGWSTKEYSYGYNLFSIHELSKVAMERCATARCAIQLMGDLAVEHGFYANAGTSTAPDFADSAEALAVGDRTGEVWMFHVMTGARNRSAVWAAQRVPDDSVVAAPNSFIIRQMDLSDKDNFMASPNVKSFAKEMGWWNPRRDGEFDFAAAYAVSDPLPLVPLYIGRRMWRIYTMLAPNLKLNPDLGYLPIFKHRTYPFSIVPVEKLYPQDFMRIMRDHYEGTPFDMTKGLAAGPFGNPTRWIGDKSVSGAWERSISVFRASYSFVAVSRPRSPIPAILWYGHDAPHGTVYVPFFSGQTSVPESYLSSKQSVFDPTGAWWAFNFINNWCQLAFNVMQPEVTKEQRRLEDLGKQLVADIDRKVGHLPREQTVKVAEKQQLHFARQVVTAWWALAHKLIATYNNGAIIHGEVELSNKTTYPAWWLKKVGYEGWPGNTFIYPKIYQQYNPTFAPRSAILSVSNASSSPNIFSLMVLAAFGSLAAFALFHVTQRGPQARTVYEYEALS